ncbi:rod shape-determining protein MreD [Allostreptomyces psammosilenae]|uniref:Rod shape-determining protein MreD n=1 Tax=Allostreptomyces psammosilenae TaxID=1892865 RepID=A0A853A7I8_9ACTN|nr:rod shape-determining protein MreD [Allostreptomyces psammosilenae]NYI06631.1 rod shape-determining protein MreD [Allostreptomyces psammosilenae]
MRTKQIVLSTLLVVVSLVFQVTVLARLQLPGAVPDLLLIVVVSLALVLGPRAGSLIGFGAGLLADLAPPADHAAGRFALVMCLVGYLAGLFRQDASAARSPVGPILMVGVAAVVATALNAGVGFLTGELTGSESGIGGLILTAVLYDLLLAPFVVPWVMALARRTQPDPTAIPSLGGAAGQVPGTTPLAGRPGRSGRTAPVRVRLGGRRIGGGRLGVGRVGRMGRKEAKRL